MFYYRGDTLFNVRYGHYKAHFYTWATPQEAIDIVSVASLIWETILSEIFLFYCGCVEQFATVALIAV